MHESAVLAVYFSLWRIDQSAAGKKTVIKIPTNLPIKKSREPRQVIHTVVGIDINKILKDNKGYRIFLKIVPYFFFPQNVTTKYLVFAERDR